MQRSVLTVFLFLVSSSVPSQATAATVKGKVLGLDGAPLSGAGVRIGFVNGDFLSTTIANADGTFEFSVARGGFYLVNFAAKGYTPRNNAAVYVAEGSEVFIAAQLGTAAYNEAAEKVEIVWQKAGGSQLSRQTALRRLDGMYVAEIETPESAIQYYVGGFSKDGSVIVGTQADEYRLTWAFPGGVYSAIAHPSSGKAQIVFDPRKLPVGGQAAKIDIRSADGSGSAVDDIYHALESRMVQEPRGVGIQSKDLDDLWRRARGEQNSIVRQAELVNWLDAALAVHTLASDRIQQALQELPVSSPAWWLRPEAAFDAFAIASSDDLSNKILALVDHLPDDTARTRTLLAYANAASAAKRYADLHAVLERLDRDYPKTNQAKIANERYGVKIVQVGKPVTEFSFPSIEAGRQYTPETLKGNVYLIDFWATWCAPCIAEMENLHRAFNRFGPKGFKILSYSLDESPAFVKKFRAERWPMPWFHAWDGKVKEPQYALFGIFQIPAAVLVGEDGTVIAFGDDVRGDKLLHLLELAYAK